MIEPCGTPWIFFSFPEVTKKTENTGTNISTETQKSLNKLGIYWVKTGEKTFSCLGEGGRALTLRNPQG